MSFDIVEHMRRVAWLADVSEQHFKAQLTKIVSKILYFYQHPLVSPTEPDSQFSTISKSELTFLLLMRFLVHRGSNTPTSQLLML